MLSDTGESRRIHVERRRSMRERVYGVKHRALRRTLAPFVEAGLAHCARCGEPIEPGAPWDLGHDDYDRTKYSGPEHVACNRAAPNRLHTSRAW
jgi:hypothetical protein